MAIASITQWLLSPNRQYLHGRMLYEQYGDDPLVLAIIKNGSGSYHLQTLIEGLEAVNQHCNLQPKAVVVEVPKVVAKKENVNLDNAPKEVRDIRNQKNENFAMARQLHASIRFMDSQEQRLTAGLKLLDLMDEVNNSWLQLDEWKETGKIAERQQQEAVALVADMPLSELMAERRNLPPRITNTRKRYNALSDPKKKTKALAKLQTLTKRLDEVKRRLNELV